MKFLRDNEFLIFLYGVVLLILVMGIAFAPTSQAGYESAYIHHSVREVLAAIVRGK